jgi:hypothetical protein
MLKETIVRGIRFARDLRRALAIMIIVSLATGCAMKGGNVPTNNQPQAAISPSSLDFGDQDIGTTSNALSLTVTNNGGSDLHVSGASIAPAQFVLAGQNSATVAPGKQLGYTLTFSPTAVQSYSGTLSITTNAGTAIPVSLAGRGRRRFSISPSSLNFGSQVVNTTSASQSVTVTNTGSSNLVISSEAISPAQFALSGPSSTTLMPGASVSYNVAFTPTTVQAYSGSLTLTTNAGTAPVSLNGNGIAGAGPPQATISPTSLAFGNQVINTTTTPQPVTVTNTGGSDLLVNSVTIAPAQFAFSGPSPTTIGPGGQAVYNVTFTPLAAQTYSGSLTFNINASPATSTVTTAGTGVLGSSNAICGKLDDGLVHLPNAYSCATAACATNPFAPPAKGSSYQDPQYGCSITRLTDAVSDNLGTAAHHNYGTVSPVSANDSYVMINLENGSKEIVDTSGGVVVPVANMPPANSQQLPWDIVIGTRFYYTTGATVQRADIAGLPACLSSHNCTVTSTKLHDFSVTYASVQIPDQEDISDDGDHLWLVGNSSAFLYTISTDTVGQALNVGTKDSATGWHKIQIMPSNRMLMTWSPNGPGPKAGQEVYNTDTTLNWHMFNNTLHTDCGRDLNNREVCVVARIPDTGGGITGAGACPTWNGSQDGGVDIIDMSSHAAQCLVDVNWADTEISFRDGMLRAVGC